MKHDGHESDADIVKLYIDRSESAISKTAEKYGAYCFSVANTILGVREDAEECVNDAYLRAWNSIPPENPENLKAYLSRIIRNLAVDRARRASAKKRPAVAAAIDELAAVIPSGDEGVMTDSIALKDALTRFMFSLSPRQRIIFMRRYFYMDDTRSIARRLTTTDTSVRVTLTKLRRKLKKFLEKEGIEE